LRNSNIDTSEMQSTPLTSGPWHIVSTTRPQFAIRSGPSSFIINALENGDVILNGTNVSFPRLSVTDLQSSRARITDLITARKRHGYDYAPNVVISAADLRGVITISNEIIGDYAYTITLPSADDVIAAQQLSVGDSITFDIINCTTIDAYIMLAGAPIDTIFPLDFDGNVVITAHTSGRFTAVLARVGIGRIVYELIAARLRKNPKYVVAPSCAALPAIGMYDTLYCVDDQNTLVRWVDTEHGYDWCVGEYPCDDFPTLEAALASPSVVDGQRIRIRNGVYVSLAPITISKRVIIRGESRESTILRTSATDADPVTFIVVNSPDVAICNLSIGHFRTLASASNLALSVSGSNFILDSVNIVNVEGAVNISSSNWVMRACSFTYRGPVTNSVIAAINIVNSNGNAHILGCHFDNTGVTSTVSSARLVEATYAPLSGGLYFENNIASGRVSEVIRLYSVTGAANSFIVSLKNNIISELDSVVLIRSSTFEFGNMFSQLVASNNRFSGAHGTGIFSIRSISGTRVFRAVGNPIPLHIASNTIVTPTIASGWQYPTGASVYSCLYPTAQIYSFGATQDAIIPPTPPAPPAPTDNAVTSTYREIGAGPSFENEVFIIGAGPPPTITLADVVLPGSLIVFKNRDLMYATSEYTTSTVGGVTVITWVGGSVTAGDRVTCQYAIK